MSMDKVTILPMEVAKTSVIKMIRRRRKKNIERMYKKKCKAALYHYKGHRQVQVQ